MRGDTMQVAAVDTGHGGAVTVASAGPLQVP
jgi:hypothetical protein